MFISQTPSGQIVALNLPFTIKDRDEWAAHGQFFIHSGAETNKSAEFCQRPAFKIMLK